MHSDSNVKERDQIVAHVHGLFEAFLKRDRDAIRRGHTADWRGFQIHSRSLVRGLDEYMANADRVLESILPTRYEIVDIDVQLYGVVAVVYYMAREWLRSENGQERTILLRSVDIYRKEGTGWNQCGSNICLVPDSDCPARTLTESERAALLADREELWRAWFTNDRTQLTALLPPETIAGDPRPQDWTDRDGIFKRSAAFVGSGAKLVSLKFPETQFQVYGDVAVLYTTYRFETEMEGKRTVHAGRGTEVFVRRDGRWLNSGWHLDAVE